MHRLETKKCFVLCTTKTLGKQKHFFSFFFLISFFLLFFYSILCTTRIFRNYTFLLDKMFCFCDDRTLGDQRHLCTMFLSCTKLRKQFYCLAQNEEEQFFFSLFFFCFLPSFSPFFLFSLNFVHDKHKTEVCTTGGPGPPGPPLPYDAARDLCRVSGLVEL